MKIPVPFYINNRYVVDVEILSSGTQGQDISIHTEGFLQSLLPYVDEELWQNMQKKISGKFVKLDVIKNLGMVIDFNWQQLTLNLKLNSQQKKTVLHGGEEPEKSYKTAIKPSDISTYFNMYHFERWSSNRGSEYNLLVENAINIKSWVLESSWDYDEQKEIIRNKESRLTHDFVSREMRLQLGDVDIKSEGLRGFKNLGGIALEKNYLLNPYKVITPIDNHTIFLKEKSEVKFYINDHHYRTLNLDSGKHELRDLPLQSGLNQIRIVAKDIHGRVEDIVLTKSSHKKILARGINQFEYYIGYPRTFEDSTKRYNQEKYGVNVSLSHLWGISNTFNLGGFFQKEKKLMTAGGVIKKGTSLGLFTSDIAFSQTDDNEKGEALLFSYEYVDFLGKNFSTRNLFFEAFYRGKKFHVYGEELTDNTFSWEFLLGGSLQVLTGTYLNVSGEYKMARSSSTNNENEKIYNLSLNKTFQNNLSSMFIYQNKKNLEGKKESIFSIFVNWSIPDKNIFISSNYESQNKSKNVSLNHYTDRKIGGFNSSLDVSDSKNDQSVSSHIYYVGNRGEMNVNYSYFKAKNLDAEFEDRKELHQGSLQFSHSFAMADGKWTWGRPIKNNFAIFDVDDSFDKKNDIIINPHKNDYDAKIDSLGKGLLTQLPDYYLSEALAQLKNIKFTESIEKNRFILYPHYKSGLYIKLQKVKTTTAKGILVDKNGSPISLMAFDLMTSQKDKTNKKSFFTNKNGEFYLTHVETGVYSIIPYDESYGTIQLKIVESKKGPYDLGKVVLPEKKE